MPFSPSGVHRARFRCGRYEDYRRNLLTRYSLIRALNYCIDFELSRDEKADRKIILDTLRESGMGYEGMEEQTLGEVLASIREAIERLGDGNEIN